MKVDFFPRFIDNAMLHKTSFGGIMSITMIIVALVLCSGELKYFLHPPIKEQLVSVSNLGGSLMELAISFNITVSVPCALLHLDVYYLYSSMTEKPKHVYKTRVDRNGNPIPLSEVAKTCGSCYGAETEERRCCNTCEDILSAYQQKQWSIDKFEEWAQCRSEGISLDGEERCNMFGTIQVNAIEGGFHIAPGVNMGNHYHDYSPIADRLDLSHEIDYITLGAHIASSPLDHTRVVQKGHDQVCYRYNLKAIPKVIVSHKGKKTKGFQYTVAYSEIPAANQRSRFGPGIFFSYNFAPVALVTAPDGYGFGILMARIVSIFGGTFMIAKLIDSFTYRINALQMKIRLNKVE